MNNLQNTPNPEAQKPHSPFESITKRARMAVLAATATGGVLLAANTAKGQENYTDYCTNNEEVNITCADGREACWGNATHFDFDSISGLTYQQAYARACQKVAEIKAAQNRTTQTEEDPCARASSKAACWIIKRNPAKVAEYLPKEINNPDHLWRIFAQATSKCQDLAQLVSTNQIEKMDLVDDFLNEYEWRKSFINSDADECVKRGYPQIKERVKYIEGLG